MSGEKQIVAVDIGGTHARFAIARIEDGRVVELGEPTTFQTRDHATFASAWNGFREANGGSLPDAAGIAVASPVGGEQIKLTNNPWVIRPAQLGKQLGVANFSLVNDFAAVAHAVAQAGEAHFIHLCGPNRPLPDAGTISIVGPGTGLGVASLLVGPGGYHVQPTEGGHIDFAPLDALEDQLLARLRQRYRRVSAERIVSGPAIVDIYESMAAFEGRSITPADDRTIWTAALSGKDDLAVAAAERFCMSLGSVAGDIALAQGGAAVVIAGGLGLRLHEMLLRSGFAERFCAKGRFEAMMADIPVKLITHSQPGLFGAAAAFATGDTD